MNNKAKIAISEILILLVGVFAFCFLISGEIGIVSADGGSTTYKIVEGDTLSKIAEKFGTTVDELLKLNPKITNPNEIKAGADLITSTSNTGLKALLSNPIIQSLGVATSLFLGTRAITKKLGGDQASQNIVGASTAGAYFLASLKSGTWFGTWGLASFGIGAGAGLVALAITYRSKKIKPITFECKQWEATTGGEKCEECNKQGIFPCSEYQCRSLGQNCELIEDKCVWKNRLDIKYPVITLWQDALTEGYRYSDDNAVSPPNKGVIIEKTSGGCIKPFTPISFGVSTDENAKCRLDPERKDKFEDMRFELQRSGFNHSIQTRFPGPDAINAEEPEIQNDGTYQFFVRCQDYNGNENPANFMFKFCVEKGPDFMPPQIEQTSLNNGGAIAFNQSSVDLNVYVNKPSDCKWSAQDKSYDEMENQMDCSESESVFQMNLEMLYECSTTLTGLKNRQENKFYFRCKSYPLLNESERRTNTQSYEFSLLGTQQLVIDSVGPNETIRDSTGIIQVTLTAETSAGADQGRAVCSFSETEEADDYTEFFYEDGGDLFSHYSHKQELYLAEGDYEYFIKCVDLGGNSDFKKVNFKVEADSEAPIVVRAYYKEGYLKLITNEPADCVYDSKDCSYSFDDGISLTEVEDTNHFTNWNTEIDFHVKCQDKYGNQPSPPDACSIIVRPSDVYSGE